MEGPQCGLPGMGRNGMDGGRMDSAGHKFSSTIHCLVSAVKKLQRLNTGVQGTWLYRGLGGLDVRDFISSNGFTERAFTSTTKSLEVALEYSGAKKGMAGAVLAMDVRSRPGCRSSLSILAKRRPFGMLAHIQRS